MTTTPIVPNKRNISLASCVSRLLVMGDVGKVFMQMGQTWDWWDNLRIPSTVKFFFPHLK